MCGKNYHFHQRTSSKAGSPPRVREKLGRSVSEIVDSRITPACAGKTVSDNAFCGVSEDHPRVCGKNVSSLMFGYQRPGSPPRVREKQPYGHQ